MSRGEGRRSPAVVLNLAPTGMVPTRAMSRTVPLQPDEIVRDVLAAADLGITVAHIHARDERGDPTHRRDVYGRIIGPLREARPDLVICASCSGRLVGDVDARADVLNLEDDLAPDMASLTLSSLNFARTASVNAPDTIRRLAERMRERGITPELEVFDLGMANIVRYLLDRDIIAPPLYVNVLFGNVATAQADFSDIGAVVGKLPHGTLWSLGGIGTAQLPVLGAAVAMAPGVRVGLEDNLWLDDGRSVPATNLDLVRRVHQVADAMGRSVMSSDDFRVAMRLERRA